MGKIKEIFGLEDAFMWAMVFSMLFNAEESKLVKRGEEDATTQSFERT